MNRILYTPPEFATLSAYRHDFKLEICFHPYTIRIMRFLAPFLALILLAGCESTDDSYVPGRIPKETAIAIASRANKQYPYPLSKVTRASWRPEHGYWAIDFKDPEEQYGKFYLVNGQGKIVGTGRIEGDNYY